MAKRPLRDTGKPRVLISGHLPPPMGGIATFYQSLLRSSLSERVNLRFVQTSSQKRPLSESGRASVFNLVSGLRDCLRFTAATLSHRPQISHIATTFGLSFIKHGICVMIARLTGSQVLMHPHCSLSALYIERSRWWRRFFRQVTQLAIGVIALSREWFQLGEILPNCHVYFLPNAISVRFYRAVAEERIAEGEKDGPINILYLGYLGRAKGSFDLIDAAKELRAKRVTAFFDLVGDELTPGEGEMLRKQNAVARLNGHLSLHPAAFGQEKITFFRHADIFVYPSYHEGMPIAVMEAMACGLPIVATRVGGLVDLVEDGVNGILVDPGRPDQLAYALQKLTVDNELRQVMGRESHKFATEKFDVEKLVGQLVYLYKKVLSETC